MDLTLGQVVISKAGRDAGKKFVVTGIIDTSYVYLSDGSLRKVEKPKKKKIKHIQLTEIVLQDLGMKLRTNQKVSNSEIRKALANIEVV
ncbi:MAG TPA: RNA-binding protein [Clostridiaceae bacterium]|nr:RNA-binding protein [Clostridiaceae bacterium]